MTNAPRHARYVVPSLSDRADFAGGRPVAALGRFFYPKPSLWPGAASVVVHAVAGAGLLWSASRTIARYAASPESALFMPPPQPEISKKRGAGSGMLAMVSLAYNSGISSGSGVAGDAKHPVRPVKSGGLDTRDARTTADSSGDAGSDVYTSFQVDNAAQISYGSVVPQYPPDLLAKQVPGSVIVRFVVDTSGTADVASIEVLGSTAPQFEESVRAALPRMRFSPARLNGKRVRQLVEQPFRFNVTPSSPTDSTA